MKPGLRALLLVLLVAGGPLAAFVPTAAAQTSGLAIRFDEDPDPCEQTQQGFSCPATFTAPTPRYLEAESVGIVLASATDAWVGVRCITNCGGLEAKRYWAFWDGSRQLQFPEFFNEPGPEGNGASAVGDKAPRFNGTWEVEARLPTGTQTRRFDVWLMDVYKSPELKARPGATYLVHARGFDSSNISLRVDHQGTGGSNWTTVHGPVALRTPTPDLIYNWEVDRAEATRVLDCYRVADREPCETYRMVISGGGKSTETFVFRLAPTVFEPVAIETTGAVPRQLERTMNLTAVYQFYYHGGTLFRGPALQPSDLPPSRVDGQQALRVRVENVTGVDEPILLDEVSMVYQRATASWRVNWTIPKDIDLGPTGQQRYQLRLAESPDRWGNKLPPIVIGNFTVTAATLTPAVEENPSEVGRTEEARVLLAIRYHNASPFTPNETLGTLQGCFVRDTSTAGCGQLGAIEAIGKHEGDGVWSFSARYAKDHADLGAYRLVLPQRGEHRDKWGNTISAARPDAFELVPGSPRIDFRTVMRGIETETLERGNRVSVQAVVRYADDTPYNHTLAPNESYELDVTLVKRASSGSIVDERRFSLREVDRDAGRYFGTLELTRDDVDTPAGNWTFRFDVRDNFTVPNRNLTEIHREVLTAPIRLEAHRQPPGTVPTEARISFRFGLHYEDGTRVDPVNLASGIDARVYRWNGSAPVGEPVSGRLQLTDVDGVYTIDYTVPARLFAGSYVFVVAGGDRFGNLIAHGALSEPFSTFSPFEPRAVLTQPALSVRRGESAAVIFDGDEGDTAVNTTALPQVFVQRWDPVRAIWVVETDAARDLESAGPDHIGVFPVGETTTIGVYRFVLVGRDRDFHPLNATSANFTVQPTQVTRAIAGTPLASVVKGELFEVAIERRDGDQVRGVDVLFNGRLVQAQTPVTAADAGVHKVIWRVPFEAAPGNYSFVFRGYDLYGNDIVVRTPNVEALAASLEGRIIGQPARAIDRGSTAKVLFGVTYPNGQFYVSSDYPTVRVLDAAGSPVGEATVVRSGLTYEASWSPPPSTPRGDYSFDITGRGTSGNIFPTLRSDVFRVGEGTFRRSITDDAAVTYERGNEAGFGVAFANGDEAIEFTLHYFGPVTDVSGAAGRAPSSSTTLPHTVDLATGRYIARFPTDLRTPAGAYRFTMTGRDADGNDIETESRVFLVRPTTLIARYAQSPPPSEFKEGTVYDWTLDVRYRSGAPLTSREGTPSAAVLLDGRPITPRPEVRWENNAWHVVWEAPGDLPAGTYSVSVGGADLAGNTIGTSASIPYPWDPPLSESFAKSIPAPGAGLLALVVLALALATRRRA